MVAMVCSTGNVTKRSMSSAPLLPRYSQSRPQPQPQYTRPQQKPQSQAPPRSDYFYGDNHPKFGPRPQARSLDDLKKFARKVFEEAEVEAKKASSMSREEKTQVLMYFTEKLQYVLGIFNLDEDTAAYELYENTILAVYSIFEGETVYPKWRSKKKSPKKSKAKRKSSKRAKSPKKRKSAKKSAKRKSSKRKPAKRSKKSAKRAKSKSKRKSAKRSKKSAKRAKSKSKRKSAKRSKSKSKRKSAKRKSAKRKSAKRKSKSKAKKRA